MKHLIALSIFILALLILPSKADLNCDEKALPSLSDIPGIGPKVASAEEDTLDSLTDLLKKWGCEVKKNAKKFGENVKVNAQKLNENVKEGVKKLTVKVKQVGSNIETKFHDFKERLNKDSGEMIVTDKKLFMENVEMIDPDILKADQECGHGHILNALGNCRKLRK